MHRPIWPIGGESSQRLSLFAGPGWNRCLIQKLILRFAQRLGLPIFERSILRGSGVNPGRARVTALKAATRG